MSNKNVPAPVDDLEAMLLGDIRPGSTFNVDDVPVTAVFEGSGLVKKRELLGVPHHITRLTFREVGDGAKLSDDKLRDYVSIEATIFGADILEDRIRRGMIPGIDKIESLTVEPGEQIIYNDGSTGIRRQLVCMLARMRAITLTSNDKSRTGDAAWFDQPYQLWTEPKSVREAMTGQMPTYVLERNPKNVEQPLKISVLRGLRISEYMASATNELTATYYLG